VGRPRILLALLFCRVSNSRPRPDGASPPAEPAHQPSEDGTTDRSSVAVLPLENYSSAAKQTSCNVMTEALTAALSQADGLQVISRTSSMHYKGAGLPLPAIARALDVDWIVEGSVLVVGGRVRVIAQLIDAASDEHIWAATYDRPFGDLLSLQAGLASAMARDVDAAIKRQQQQFSASTGAVPAHRLAARAQ
jgi:TolB-like protein